MGDSTTATTTTTKKSSHHYVLISCVDTYGGHALAYHLANELERRPGMLKKHWRVRALCHSLEGLQDLVAMDVDLQVRYCIVATLEDLNNMKLFCSKLTTRIQWFSRLR